MFRWFLITLLLIGSVCLFSSAPLITSAHAQADVPSILPAAPASDTPVVTPTTPATPVTTPDTTTPSTTPSDSAPAAAPAGNTAAEAPATAEFPSKSAIRDALTDGRVVEAEQAYLEWVSFWGDDDPVLASAIEHAVLLQDYHSGKFTALIDMVRAGDPEAINLLRKQISSAKNTLPPADFAEALRILGERKDKTSFDTLRLALFNSDSGVVNAAIEALGNLGDRRAISDLQAMFEKADLDRGISLVRALTHLGLGAEMQQRYLVQLRFPLPGVREKAALILAALGNSAGWSTISGMVSTKDPAYYPLVLSVLSALPSAQSQEWVSQGLAGTEQEQLAALQSLSIFSVPQKESILLQLVRDAKTPQSVRLSAVNVLAGTSSMRAYKELRALAMRFEPSNPKDASPARDPEQIKMEAQITAQAMLGLQQWGLQKNTEYRKYMRIRMDENTWNEDIVLAARSSLLKYALDSGTMR